MLPILAQLRIVQWYVTLYSLVGPGGMVIAFAVALLLIALALFKGGAKVLFIIFLCESLFCSTDPQAATRTIVLTMFRYFLLFPVALRGMISLFSRNRRLGSVGILLLLHTILFVITTFANAGYGLERLIALFLLWFALVGNIAGEITDIEKLKDFLSKWGIASWFVVFITVAFLMISPSESFLAGRFRSMFARPNSLAIAMFFLLVPLGYRALLMSPNKFRSLDITAFIIAVIFIIMSGTRSAGFALVPLLLVLFRGRSKSYIIIAAFILVLIVGISWRVTSIREVAYLRFLGGDEITTAGRLMVWRSQWPVVLQKPFFGHGLGCSDLPEFVGVFNSYLSISLEGGLVNGVLFTLVVLISLIGGYFKLRHLISVPDRRVGWLLVGATSGIIFICVFESIASGIGAGGIVVVWTILLLSVSIRPAVMPELYYDDSERSYGYSTPGDGMVTTPMQTTTKTAQSSVQDHSRQWGC